MFFSNCDWDKVLNVKVVLSCSFVNLRLPHFLFSYVSQFTTPPPKDVHTISCYLSLIHLQSCFSSDRAKVMPQPKRCAQRVWSWPDLRLHRLGMWAVSGSGPNRGERISGHRSAGERFDVHGPTSDQAWDVRGWSLLLPQCGIARLVKSC